MIRVVKAALALLVISAEFLSVNHDVCAATMPLLHSSNLQEIATFLGSDGKTAKAKIVFVNTTTSGGGQLCYMDFSEEVDTPVIRTIEAVKDAKVPVVSPDGKWVVYSAGKGGEAGNPVGMRSSVYLCKIEEKAEPVLIYADSAAEPRFMFNVTDGSDTIIFPTLAPNRAWKDPMQGKTMKVGITCKDGIPKVGEPQVLWDKCGFAGGLSWDKQFICSGGEMVALFDLEKGDSAVELGSGCNVSITPSRITTNRIMYLNSGGSLQEVENGKNFKAWQVIFISDINRKFIRYYPYPTEFRHDPQTDPVSYKKVATAFCWHHPEWSNHPEYAAATVNINRFFTIGTGEDAVNQYTNYQERLYMLRLTDGAYLEVARVAPEVLKYQPDTYNIAAGIFWPWLWVEVPEDFKETELSGVKQPRLLHKNSTGAFDVVQRGTHLYTHVPITSLTFFALDGRSSVLPQSAINGCTADISGNSLQGTQMRIAQLHLADGNVVTKTILTIDK